MLTDQDRPEGRPTMVRLNVGFIGAGERARNHLSVLSKLNDRYRLVAICDIDEDRARNVAEEAGAKPYMDPEMMLGKEKLDACLIAVQAEGHHIVARALAQRGIHILTETPIAMTVPCADQMVEAASENGVYLEVSENVPRWPHERLKQKIVAANLLGTTKEFYVSYTSGSYHGMAAIRSLLKTEAENVVGEFPQKGPVFERAEILFLNGVRGTYENNLDRDNYWEMVGTKGCLRGGRLCLFDDEMELEIQHEIVEVDGKPRIAGARVDTQPETSFRDLPKEYSLADYDEVAIADTWISLHQAVTTGRPLTYGAENARKDLELLMAVRDSALRKSAKVHLPLKGITEYEKIIHAEFAKVYGSDPLESSLQDLKVRYVLPDRLRELMYHGRID